MTAHQNPRSGPSAAPSQPAAPAGEVTLTAAAARGTSQPAGLVLGGASPAGLISPPRYAGGQCACGHLDVFHDLKERKAGWTRTACSWTTGPQISVCGCQLYQEAA